jgi:hypothetical protein
VLLWLLVAVIQYNNTTDDIYALKIITILQYCTMNNVHTSVHKYQTVNHCRRSDNVYIYSNEQCIPEFRPLDGDDHEMTATSVWWWRKN